ncbi:Peptidase M23 [Actinobacteria bacterium OK074]|nr:Peptidase M23 [Actinobacteria bacterium OK074]
MNDPHPSGTVIPPTPASDAAPAHYAPYGQQGGQYGEFTPHGDPTATTPGFDTTGFDTGAYATDVYATGAYTTGSYPTTGTYDAHTHAHTYDTGAHAYATDPLGTGTHHTLNYDMYAAQHHATYDTGAYETTSWNSGYDHLGGIPAQGTVADSGEQSGQWDANAWLRADRSEQVDQTGPTQQWEWGTQAFDTGAYDATQWNSVGTEAPPTEDAAATAVFPATATAPTDLLEPAPERESAPLPHPHPLLDGQEEFTPTRAASRSRRRTPPKRSALLTVAVPSACVMSVAGIAAASVGMGGDDGQDTTASASESTAVKPSKANSKLDTQLANVSAGADDFADRASRTQERIDLKAQQAAEKQKAAAEAARKERLRPKFALPVTQHGLSAYFGQAGVNWMSVHTGIDFPVSYGTTVMAATDGTVRTQWNSAYGNMMIVTAKDGTETWYCHLSNYVVASGTTVKAGQAIAHSGNSGNSTGPHLHFEVRPSGGSAIDPLPWLRSHGLDPT